MMKANIQSSSPVLTAHHAVGRLLGVSEKTTVYTIVYRVIFSQCFFLPFLHQKTLLPSLKFAHLEGQKLNGYKRFLVYTVFAIPVIVFRHSYSGP